MSNLVQTIFNTGGTGLVSATGEGAWFSLVTAKDLNFIIRGAEDLAGAGSDVLTLWIESSNSNDDSQNKKDLKPIYLTNPSDGTISTTLATILGNTTRASDPKTPSTLQAYKYPVETGAVSDRFVRVAYSTSGTSTVFKNITVDIAYNKST